jgi:hypothetical protein
MHNDFSEFSKMTEFFSINPALKLTSSVWLLLRVSSLKRVGQLVVLTN